MKRLVLWGAGFIVLFLINALVELALLPLWGLDNTDKNDIYFISWWIVVGMWLVFGNEILKALDRRDKTAEAGHSRMSG